MPERGERGQLLLYGGKTRRAATHVSAGLVYDVASQRWEPLPSARLFPAPTQDRSLIPVLRDTSGICHFICVLSVNL